jgi:fatty acid-binding protein DegV
LVSYAIVHGNDLQRAQRFTHVLSEKLGQAPVFVEEVSTIVAMSAGPKTVAVALQLKPKSNQA